MQIADGLDELHRKSVVHRDPKSGNIMLTVANVSLGVRSGIRSPMQPL
jgi:serine/threonine protein kinase